MKKLHILFALGAVALLPRCNCGDNNATPDAFVKKDAAIDAGFPAVPALGAQIDRMGRPAINTALTHAFDVNPTTKGAAQDAYNQDTAVAQWPATYVPGKDGFAFNLALYDALDSGLTCADGQCQGAGGTNGCGNQPLFASPASATSYNGLAGVLADDQLYVDTSKSTCGLYLAVEFGVVTGAGNTVCGGRQPTDDVGAITYTAVAIGIGGFKASDGSFTPFIHTGPGVVPHADVSNTAFPFLGAPH